MPTRSRPASRPLPPHFTLWGHNRVYGIFRSLEDVHRCTARLLEQGLGDRSVQVLLGEEGERILDSDGHLHGLWGRFLRLLQGMTDERPHIERYVHALERGEIVLSVDVTDRPDVLARVAAAFRESGASFVNHYGRWVVEPLNA